MQRDPLACHNERMKLMAAFLNAVGIGLIAVGVLRPLAEGVTVTGLSLFLWVAVGLVFHVLALYVLRYLRKEASI
ncbi:hypothetical protein [Falsirhodobacter algicola]|nr:hypothetical protein [Falsirhodobacter algicola]